MKKILAAVDGSAQSLRAAREALEMAGPLGAHVTLIHVAPPGFPPEVPLAPVEDLRQAALARSQALLSEATQTLERKDLNVVSLYGSPAEAIADLALDDGYDLVVVGDKGRGPVSRVLLGSVADRLVHICKRPVMVVR